MKNVKKVTVMFKYEGITDSATKALLVVDKRLAIVSNDEVAGVYPVVASDRADVWVVDLDANSEDQLKESPALLLELIEEISA